MARALKTGKRTKTGRLSRAGNTPKIDKGTEKAAFKTDLFGQNGCDAIGRAFVKGFLGNDNDAKVRLDGARAIQIAYWSTYGTGPIRCTLADISGVSTGEGNIKREDWLKRVLDRRNAHATRQFFDALVIDINPDCGPNWLDRLLAGAPDNGDSLRLRSALTILDDCLA